MTTDTFRRADHRPVPRSADEAEASPAALRTPSADPVLPWTWLILLWERIAWHPFVGVGVGPYFLQSKDNGRAFGDSETKVGINLGGGVEYFLGPRLALKGEGRYHAIADARAGQDPSGLTMTVGLKRYF
jgi:hypothetical protein